MSSVDKTIDRYAAAWNTMDFDTLESLWHAGEAEIYYVAEEVDEPFYTLDNVVNYWRKTSELIEHVELTLSDKHIKALSGKVCVVTFQMHLDARMRGSAQSGAKPIGVDVRVSTILRDVNDEWLFIHYAEAPLGALPFIRKAYNANIRT